MKTLITQPLSAVGKLNWKMLPALLVALCSLCALSVNAQTFTIGTGTSMYSSTQTSPPSPLGWYNPTARSQYIYTKAEMLAAGMTSGPIHQIGFNVGALNGSTGAPNFTISVGFTSVAVLSTGYLPVTQVYNNGFAGWQPTLGWNYIPVQVTGVFNWNGVDNVVIDVCYGKGATGVGPGCAGVYYNTVTGGCLSSSANVTPNYCGGSISIIGGSVSTIRPNIRFNRLAPCTGVPSSGTISPSGVISTLCPGTVQSLSVTNYTNALNTNMAWQSSPNGTTWTTIPGTNSPNYTTPPLVGTTYYRFRIICTNTSDTTYSGTTANPNPQFTFPGGFPVYGSVPYYEGFETWGNGCSTNDKPTSNNWTNIPSTGNSSWRRDDDGATASWSAATSPVASLFKEGAHSARWHGYQALINTPGEGVLTLYVNTSATAGNKDLSFWYNFHYGSSPTYPGDSLNVDMSTDGGLTFAPLAQIGYQSVPLGVWNKYTAYNIAVSSPTTVFRFRAKELYAGYDDVFLDAVTIVPPCAGQPVAGKIDTIVACTGQTFTLNAKGTTAAAGLSYLWQYKPPSSPFWSSLPGGNVPNPTTSMTAATSYRLIVACTNVTPNLTDTSAVYTATLAPFYYCYCGVSVPATYVQYQYVLVSNAKIETQPAGVALLNNGVPFPTIGNPFNGLTGYEDFRLTIPPATLVRDSTYKLSLTQSCGPAYTSFLTGMYAVAWLDYDQSGTFDPLERFMFKTVPSQSNPTATQLFTIPTAAPVGITGLRVTIQYYYSVYGINPCGPTYAYGQIEDYLVKIEYTPCTGPVNPGTAIVSDTSVCPGYTIDLVDTTYEKTHTNIIRYWQVSTNNGASYSVIPGSLQKDMLLNVVVTASSRYRLMAICGPSGDTTYSNAVIVSSPSPVHCYPVSTSALGSIDSTDIGAFIIGSFYNPAPGVPAGPHLSNPAAHKRHSDFTKITPIELYADSTYRLAVFQTMPGVYHADALVSVFLDYNNNLNYDVTPPPPPTPFTSELVFQGRTRFDSFFLDTKFKVPSAVIPNVLTGMRVIINNDVSMVPSNPALSGAGLFTSGEVEDYIVIFRRAGLSAGSPTLLQNLALYPNPTEGKFTVLSDAARSVSHMEVIVTTITGQQVLSRSFENVGMHFTTSLDLSKEARGIYFVEIHADGEKITRKLIVQ